MARFSKLLIANRGEIAVRVARSARSLGYRTVAIYSDVDRDSPHVTSADEAVRIGGAAAVDSYLSIERVLAAAQRSGADAVHPGYGFLSENADFAEACSAAGLTFVGPPAGAIRLMGNKAAAKACMLRAGVPCVPGYAGAQDDAALHSAAAGIGFPVMIKAAAGGGGKGMRLVETPEHFLSLLEATRNEARRAFGSDEILLEKALLAPRHIEMQIFADEFGNIVHLGERDCSIQRRHQKVIEEAPSPAVSNALRERMGSAAIEAARAVAYVGAGTIEFLLDAAGAFYFLEMNTRLQVEHAVTEALTGTDLVAWQLRVAAGEPLPVAETGAGLPRHAIEARLYAEDPRSGFLPQAGHIVGWIPPQRDGVRIDHALAPQTVISPYYDPLLAKVIAHGSTREEARRRLSAALEDLVVFGVVTNREFLCLCLAHPVFIAGEACTDFVPRFFGSLASDEGPDFPSLALAAVLFEQRSTSKNGARGWRSNGVDSSSLVLRSGERVAQVELTLREAGAWSVAWNGQLAEITVLAREGGSVRFLYDGLQRSAAFAFEADSLYLHAGARTVRVDDALVLAAREAAASSAAGPARSPMPGIVVEVAVRAGDRVVKGQRLVVLEAMKMLHEIAATGPAIVSSVLVAAGAQVAMRAPLVELTAPA